MKLTKSNRILEQRRRFGATGDDWVRRQNWMRREEPNRRESWLSKISRVWGAWRITTIMSTILMEITMTWTRLWWVSRSLRVLELVEATKSATECLSMILTSSLHWVMKSDLSLLRVARTILRITKGKMTKPTRTWDTNSTRLQQSQMQLDTTQECIFWQAVTDDRVNLHQIIYRPFPWPKWPRTTRDRHRKLRHRPKIHLRAITRNHLIKVLASSRSSRWWTGRASLSDLSNARLRTQQRCSTQTLQ